MAESTKKPQTTGEVLKRFVNVALVIGALLVGAEVIGDL